MATRLHVVITEKGGAPRTEHFDAAEITIGRTADNDIALPKGNITKRHSRIVVRDGNVIIVDLKSTNGTFVNGKRISSPQIVKPTDKVYVGDYTLEVRLEPVGDFVEPPPTPRPSAPPPEVAAGGPRIELVHRNETTIHPLGRAVIGIGRHPENDIIIDDRTLSRFHARIERRGDVFVVVDLGAQNGITVDGARVTGERTLSEGNRIDCGRAQLFVRGVGTLGYAAHPPRPRPPPPPSSNALSTLAKELVASIRDPHTREIDLREDEPARVIGGAALGNGVVTPRALVVALLNTFEVPVQPARPVFDGPLPHQGTWRVTASIIDGAPARMRLRRTAKVSLDDDVDPIPPG